MKLISINISNFGKFNNFQLDFDEGLNVIYGDNESGKSTLMNFVLMMFYGGKSRKKDLLDNPRKKYRPWNGETMKGYIIFQDEGREYRLYRTFRETNAKDEIKLIDNHTGEDIVLENMDEPGKHFFKMSFESFNKSLFIDSEDLAFTSDSSKELSEKLLNLISTSDEDVSYEKTKSLLESKLYEFKSKSGKKGILVDLEEKIYEEKRALQEAKLEEDQKKKILQDLERLKAEIDLQTTEDKANSYEYQLEKAREAFSKNEDRKALEREVYKLDGERALLFSELDAIKVGFYESLDLEREKKDEKTNILLEKQALSQSEQMSVLSKEVDRWTNFSQYILIPLLLSLLAAMVLFFKNMETPAYVLSGLLVVFLIGKIYIDYELKKKKEEYSGFFSEYTKQMAEIDSTLADKDLELANLASKIVEDKLLIREKELSLDMKEAYYKDKKEQLERIRQLPGIHTALDPRILESSLSKVEELKMEAVKKAESYSSKYGNRMVFELDEGETHTLRLNKEYERLKAYSLEKYKNSRYMDEIKASIATLQEELDEKRNEYKAIEEAISALDESYQDLSHNFGPILNEKSQEIFQKLTGGKYEKLLVTNDFDINFEDGDAKEIKNWQYLSSGARDQAYIALKIALAKLIGPEAKSILLLDDIFVKFDELRAFEGVKFLADLGEDFEQIILFTCHKRIFDALDEKVKKITL